MAQFTINSTAGNSVTFDSSEATDTGQTQPFYSILRGVEESAGGRIKQQIRPGKRFNKTYQMNLTQSKYISFHNLYTDQSNDYYITYATAPSLLSNDSSVSQSNNFKISLHAKNVSQTKGQPIIYEFLLTIQSVNLL